MNISKVTTTLLSALILFSISSLVLAGAGHDHDDANPSKMSSALPRFSADSELFELVGIVNDKEMTLYLDHFADNSPVNNVQLEIEINGNKFKAKPHGEGEYEITLKEPLKPGVTAVTASIISESVTDILAAELDLHEEQNINVRNWTWKTLILWLGVVILVSLVFVYFLRKRAQRTAT